MSPVCAHLVLAYWLAICSLAQNITSGTRNYTVDIKVSDIWYSGSSDTLYFQLCNENLVLTNTSTLTSNCLKWYIIDGGMENRGDWYEFEYIEQPNIGKITNMKLVTYNNDQFCFDKIRIDDTPYVSSEAVSFQCMEVSDTKPTGSCYVVDIELSKDSSVKNQPATFTGTAYDTAAACKTTGGIDTSVNNTIIEPPIPITNGTRTYEISVTVSNAPYSGTREDLYLRLCKDAARLQCTQICDEYAPSYTNCEADWFVFVGGVNEEGDTYKGYWNTRDIGDVAYADIVTFGSDQFCLSRISVDGAEADAGTFPECISDDTADGCTTLSIDIANQEFASSESDQCGYGITNNNTFVAVDDYLFKFKTGSIIFCGAESTIYFVFCTVDGSTSNVASCSRIYELAGQLPETGTEYEYTVSIDDYPQFNSLSDIYFIDIWEYDTEFWCLSDLTVDGMKDGNRISGYNADSGSPALSMESPADGGKYCEGVRVYIQTNVWDEFTYGPTPECRWNDYLNANGTILLSRSNADATDW
eukprot:CAMPEP_0197026976 /NCGR_PEP_ID=MMETSP1384-20130603/6978_1 /TAXON_ID=29189 /ORGANISM="Ammonia sp." /LENGTH=528 /DNA_ID=CAMNT_0042455759 /DNA_START=14 /DNA_END=1597 /DNA_ORIENTATION=+